MSRPTQTFTAQVGDRLYSWFTDSCNNTDVSCVTTAFNGFTIVELCAATKEIAALDDLLPIVDAARSHAHIYWIGRRHKVAAGENDNENCYGHLRRIDVDFAMLKTEIADKVCQSAAKSTTASTTERTCICQ